MTQTEFPSHTLIIVNSLALIKFKRAERQNRECLSEDEIKAFLERIKEPKYADKTAYCLRHTFATICQQYVRPDIVDIWMGDSPDRLVGRVYTHFSDKFMREQMDLVTFPILTP